MAFLNQLNALKRNNEQTFINAFLPGLVILGMEIFMMLIALNKYSFDLSLINSI